MILNAPDNTKLGDLTLGEFKAVIRSIVEDVVQQAVFELEQELPDPDAGKEMRSEFTEKLRQAIHEEEPLITLDEVANELGLNE
ncbi:MAG: hypothetical protein H0X30_33110 [Anaerolineae bacterium]|nr:hypothetical protein [Anaerolineae bacterium]